MNFFCDEFQSFGSSVFAPLLSETRKYGLNITLAHQFMQQLPPDVRHAIIGNVGTIIAFGIGAFDAELIAKEFAKETSEFNDAMLTTLPPFDAYIKRHARAAAVVHDRAAGQSARPSRNDHCTEQHALRTAALTNADLCRLTRQMPRSERARYCGRGD